MDLNLKSLDKKLNDSIVRFDENLDSLELLKEENIKIKQELIDSYNRVNSLSRELNKLIGASVEKYDTLVEETKIQVSTMLEKINKQQLDFEYETKKTQRDFFDRTDNCIDLLRTNNQKEFEKFNLNVDSIKKYILELNKGYEDKFKDIKINFEVLDKEIKKLNNCINALNRKNIELEFANKSLHEKINKNFKINILVSVIITFVGILVMYFLK